MKAIKTKMSMSDVINYLQEGESEEEKARVKPVWDFEPDEYIVLRNPLTCPMKYIWDDAKEGAELSTLPEDDPKKQEFIKRRNHTTLMWSFADWCLYDEEGEPIPPIHPTNDTSWFILSDAQRLLLELLIVKMYYQPAKTTEEQEVALPIMLDESDDPLSDKA